MGEILTKQEGRGRERERGCKILETSGERLVEKQADHRRETGRSPERNGAFLVEKKIKKAIN